MDAASVVSAATFSGVEEYESLKPLAIGLVAEVLLGELMVAGDFVNNEFVQRPLQPAKALAEIVRDWEANWFSNPPDIGTVVYLRNTDLGNSIALSVLARERSS